MARRVERPERPGSIHASFLRRPGAADGLAAGAGRKTPAAPGGEESTGADAWQPGKTGIYAV